MSSTGPEHTREPGWYQASDDASEYWYWDGGGWTDRAPRLVPPAQSGWKSVEGEYLWWDGTQYTIRAVWDGTRWRYEKPNVARARATPFARNAILALAFAGCALLAWAPTRAEERPCEASDFTSTDVSNLWLPWFGLLLLVVVGYAIWQGQAPEVAWIKRMVILGIVAAGLTFPGLVACLGAMNCSM